jgi:DNA ligase-1
MISIERFPILYKRTATGAIQQWSQERQNGRYRTISGQVGGQLTTSLWTEAKPKNVGRANETSPTEQAILEIESNYTRKRKDGYSATIAAAEDSTRFQPMLAKSFDDYAAKLLYPVFVQPKLDGIRCIANASGLWSRKGDRIVSCPHLEEALGPFFNANPHVILDGELYNHDMHDDFNQITSLVKKLKITPEHAEKTEALVGYHVYDWFNIRDQTAIFSNRSDLRAECIDIIDSRHLVFVETRLARTPGEVDDLYFAYLNKNYEGAMVRADGPYQQKRTDLLLKRKEFVDSEFKVLEVVEGEGNAAGGAKAVWLELDTDPKKRFKADVVGTKAERVKALENAKKLIGRMATVKYFKQRTPAGIPRFGKVKLIWEGEKW